MAGHSLEGQVAMPTVAELQAQLQAAEQAEAQQAQAEQFKEIVPKEALDTAIGEIAQTYNDLIAQIGLRFGEDGNLIVPDNTGAILDVSYKIWFTLGRNKIDSMGRPAQQPQPQPLAFQQNGAAPQQAHIPQQQQAAPAPAAGGRSAYCSCDHQCRNQYAANANTHFMCGCEQLGCIDTKYGKPCGCIARQGEVLREMQHQGKTQWRWMPN